ncbi:MAG: ethanolamine permease [Gammaproteobacteria bacterium]
MSTSSGGGLRRALGSWHLWGIGVGLVISGEYFGWNYGWGEAGTIGFLIATLLITVLYTTFVFSFAELSTAIPHAGGPFAFAHRALGPFGGLIAGYATLVEFVFAPPAIAYALGGYVHFLFPQISVMTIAIGSYVVFVGINLLGVKQAAAFELFVTVVAIIELLIFMGVVGPHFSTANFMADPMPHGIGGIFAAIPFAIWFYLAIEGLAMAAEEAHEPKRTIPKGFIAAIATLVILALGVMFIAGGVGDWHQLSDKDYPLPAAMAMAVGKDSGWVHMLVGIGLFGLIASFHGIIIGYSRQMFALARAGYLPGFLAKVHPRFQTPHWALIAGGVIGIIALYSGKTDELITMAAIGAVVMYIISMISLFVLRKTAPEMHRPYKVPFYPVFPAIAVGLSILSLVAMVYYNLVISGIFAALFAVALVYYLLTHGQRQGQGIELSEADIPPMEAALARGDVD